jgi:8-oxo-dGTP diphosphatase
MATNRDVLGERRSAAGQPDPVVRTGAKALVTTEAGVLLVRERHADGTPFWTLPGGGSRRDESPGETLRRELREELDCAVRVDDPVTTFWYAHTSRENALSVHTVISAGLLSRPEPVRSEGILECRWVDPAAPPAATLPQVRYLL